MNSHDGHDIPIHIVPPRAVSESQSQMAEVVLPNDANPLGNLLGGRLMHFIDIAGALAAHRHVVTASIDHIDFRRPVQIGDLLILKSSVNRAFNTSMERRKVLGGKLYRRDHTACSISVSHVRGSGCPRQAKIRATGIAGNGRRETTL